MTRRREAPIANPLTRKLERFVRLSPDEKAALDDLAAQRVRDYAARDDIVRQGQKPPGVTLVLAGYACRYRLLEDGRRQIVALFVPGDLCDPHVFILREMDHSIGALGDMRLAEIEKDAMLDLLEGYPRITRALWWSALVDEAIAREWIVNVGARSARERMAHFFCELYVRQHTVGLTRDGLCDMPLTQAELSEVLGVTPVHTNRVLQGLRAEGLVELRAGRLHVPDFAALADAGLFSVGYLHLEHEGEAFDANEY